VACQEEQTAGEADYSEIFTVCKDVSRDDERVENRWPCHGPTPWPDAEYRESMLAFMDSVGGAVGEKLLALIALGLGLDIDALTNLTADGWHHMRVLRFQTEAANSSRGIGAHTDYGLLVIAVQRGVDGLDIRPPINQHGEREQRKKNWLPGQSTAGEYDSDPHWLRVPLVPGVVTVFPGDLLQYITGDYLISTPHKVVLHQKIERFAIAYFHEPNFSCSVRPLLGENEPDEFFYGKHFTDMFMRCYPERSTTRRIEALGLYAGLESIRRAGLDGGYLAPALEDVAAVQ
jgi:isopenicillin N synthase-like dioxygenase